MDSKYEQEQSRIVHIKNKLPLIKERDPEYMQFGAERWCYEWPQPASGIEIAASEGRLGLPLPLALRTFYAQIANGGPGPAYGMYPLDDLEVLENFGFHVSEPDEIRPQQRLLMERLTKPRAGLIALSGF